ncbi:MAG: polyprenyl synthetase family protein [Solirubrobacteraceae bacterium]|nr:polyprenyl synthetase family protein [Solirubrobacteraceae bacterium]
MTAVPPTVAAVFGAAGPALADRARTVDALITTLVDTIPGPTGSRAAGVVAAGGKRLRPLLALLLAGDGDAPADHVEGSLLVSAAAVELVHVATLVHDDVLDRAPLRRGVQTVWATDGPAAATGAGDALLAAAFQAVAADCPADVARILATAASSLAAGELMQRADAYRLDITTERYEERVIGKTAALFEAACRIGAVHGDVGEDLAGGIGRDLGVAFQMLDDLLDIEGDPAVTGKARGTDLLDGTVTLPLAIAARREPSIAAVDLPSLDIPAAAALCDQIVASGACEEVRGMAYARIDAAQSAISGLPGAPSRREALALAARGLVDRTS